MLQFTPSTSTPSSTPYNEKRYLARLRRIAKIRGFRILRDWTNSWSLVDTRIAPPRALIGLWQVDLDDIDAALSTPPPPPKTRTRRPQSVAPIVGSNHEVPLKIVDAEYEPVEPVSAEPLSFVEVLEQEFDVAAILEKLRLLKAKVQGR